MNKKHPAHGRLPIYHKYSSYDLSGGSRQTPDSSPAYLPDMFQSLSVNTPKLPANTQIPDSKNAFVCSSSLSSLPSSSVLSFSSSTASPSKRHVLVARLKERLSSSLFRSAAHHQYPDHRLQLEPTTIHYNTHGGPRLRNTNVSPAKIPDDLERKLEESFPYRGKGDLIGIDKEEQENGQRQEQSLAQQYHQPFHYTDNPTHTSYVANRGSARRAFSLIRQGARVKSISDNNKHCTHVDKSECGNLDEEEKTRRDCCCYSDDDRSEASCEGDGSMSLLSGSEGFSGFNQLVGNQGVGKNKSHYIKGSTSSFRSSSSGMSTVRSSSSSGYNNNLKGNNQTNSRLTRLHRLRSFSQAAAETATSWHSRPRPEDKTGLEAAPFNESHNVVDWCVKMTPHEYYYPTVDTATRNLFFTPNRTAQTNAKGLRHPTDTMGSGQEDLEGMRALFKSGTKYMRRMKSLGRGDHTMDYASNHHGGDYNYEDNPVEIYQDPQPLSASTVVYDGGLCASGGLSRNNSGRYTARSARSVYSNTTVSSSKSSAGGGGALSQRTVLRSRVNGNSQRELARLRELERQGKSDCRGADAGGGVTSSVGASLSTGVNTPGMAGNKRRAEGGRARRRKRRMGAQLSANDLARDLQLTTEPPSSLCSPATTQYIFNDMQDVYSLMMDEESLLFE